MRAAKMADLSEVPAFIRTADDEQMLEMALIENTHREDLNAMEVAINYKRLIDECNLKQEDLAEKVGKNRTTVTNYLRLLKLLRKFSRLLKIRPSPWLMPVLSSTWKIHWYSCIFSRRC